MANEKVSQLTELTSTEMSPEDIFLVGDVSARESKKMTAAELLEYVEISGSIDALTAVTAETASYVDGANVHGIVTSSSYASASLSASYALRAGTATSSSFALTASYVASTSSLVASSSFLVYSANNGSASYAVAANTAFNASQSAFLVYSSNNGTASFAMTASNVATSSFSNRSLTSTSASWSSASLTTTSGSYSTTASFAETASFASNFINPLKAWAMVTWSYGGAVSQPQLYLTNNVGTIKYVDTFTTDSFVWFNFGVTFTNALSSTDYIMIGQAEAPYHSPAKQDFVFHPVYSNRTTSSCTMSVAVISTVGAAWFSAISASKPAGMNPYVTFQVLG